MDGGVVESGLGVEIGAAGSGEGLLHLFQCGEPVVQAFGLDTGGDVSGAAVGIVNFEGVVLRAEVAAARGPLAGQNGDVARDVHFGIG